MKKAVIATIAVAVVAIVGVAVWVTSSTSTQTSNSAAEYADLEGGSIPGASQNEGYDFDAGIAQWNPFTAFNNQAWCGVELYMAGLKSPLSAETKTRPLIAVYPNSGNAMQAFNNHWVPAASSTLAPGTDPRGNPAWIAAAEYGQDMVDNAFHNTPVAGDANTTGQPATNMIVGWAAMTGPAPAATSDISSTSGCGGTVKIFDSKLGAELASMTFGTNGVGTNDIEAPPNANAPTFSVPGNVKGIIGGGVNDLPVNNNVIATFTFSGTPQVMA